MTFNPALPNMYRFPVVSSGEETMPRIGSMISTFGTATGVLRFSYFRSRKTEAITQMKVVTGGTAAAATPTLVRFGVYTVDLPTGDLTLAAAIANDTTLCASTNTSYTRTLTSTFNKKADTVYAAAFLIVTAATAPTMYATVWSLNATERAVDQRPSAIVNSQTDLPSSVSNASLADASTGLYFHLLP